MTQQELELPKGWVKTTLGKVSELYVPMRDKPKKFDGNIPWLRIDDFDGKYAIDSKSNQRVSQKTVDEMNLKIYPTGTVLCSCSATIGVCAITKNKLVTNQTFIGIFPNKSLYNEFLYYNMLTQTNYLTNIGTGNTIKYISRKKFENLPIKIPPQDEQKRIVSKIEELFSKIDSTKKSLEYTKLQLEQYRHSLLKSAFEGKLTEKWRDFNPYKKSAQILLDEIAKKREKSYSIQLENAKSKGLRKSKSKFLLKIPKLAQENNILPQSWTAINVDFLAFVTKLAGFEYTEFIRPQDTGEVPLIRAQNVQMGRFDHSNIKFISKEISDKLVRSQIIGCEILMVFVGAGTGNVCLAPTGKQWHLAPNVAKIEVDGINKKYLCYYLQSPIGILDNLSRVKASAQQSLSMENIRLINVNLPPLEEQEEIVSQIEQGFSLVENSQRIVNSTLQTLETIRMSVLKQAFEGKLVPQDPNDEPASVLLERIKKDKK